jgi:hypothetical protein
MALAERFARALLPRVLVISDRPPAGPPGVEVVADPALRVHGLLSAVLDAVYVVLRAAGREWPAGRLRSIGVRV